MESLITNEVLGEERENFLEAKI